MLIAIGVLSLLALLASGAHIGVALGLVAAALLVPTGVPTVVIAQTAFKAVDSYPLLAIAFFVLVGNLMMHGNLAAMLVGLVGTVMRALKGGMAVTVMVASVFFAAVSGSSVASAATIGASMVEGLKAEGYPERFAAGLIATAGTLGIMIPPSLTFIVIGAMIGLPIDRLFIAGIVPGLVEAALITAVTVYLCRTRGYGITTRRADWTALARKVPHVSGVLVMPLLVLGGIYQGLVTPTEASVVAAAYAIVCVLIYRTMSIEGVWRVLKQSVLQTTMIYVVVVGGTLLGFALTRMGVSAELTRAVTAMDLSPTVFLMAVNALLLLLGMFLDGVALIVLTAPILFPLATNLGVDPIHFAVVMTANVEIATLTPPVGMNLFVMSGIAKLPVEDVARGVLPFYGVRLFALMLITYVPWLSLVLVR